MNDALKARRAAKAAKVKAKAEATKARLEAQFQAMLKRADR